ncbi:equilibrative nucleoside transporter [Anopheles darlingi]|uniref:Equilibrative nucleoside transporter n=1 Tax=Anopheles darlingi TaxID=43151 RepID=W5JB74_ANODA|nr:equilibrative nucleoside transporter 4 [Anopheles darlingi]ETN61712.1 equilibrative nucleoside transporter [Anopheles darlingi]
MMEASENGSTGCGVSGGSTGGGGGHSSSYEPLEGRRTFDTADSPDLDGSGGGGAGPPKDRRRLVFFALMTAGVGFVLPYNSFIIASDYWQSRFPGQSVALDMSMTYIIVALATVLLNNVFLTLAPFRVRVAFGYAVSFTTLVFVALCEVAWHMFTAKTAYSVNLAAVSLVAMGCTIQQSSFYGFASMLPKQYTQAVMAGESLAGFLVSSNRVVTKLLIKSDRASTAIFFLTSTVYIAFSYVLHSITTHSPFVRYYMKACAKIVLRPDDDHTLSETMDGGGDTASARYGVLTLDASPPVHMPPGSTALSFSNPVYDLSNPSAGTETVLETNLTSTTTTTATRSIMATTTTADVPNVAFKVEHVMTPDICSAGRFGSFRSGLESRWKVARAIYPYMACIAMAYCVTLSLYPGIESEIISCNLGTWMPVLLMFTFNASDVAGKLLAAVPYSWSRRQLILMSGLRALLVPLILLCCSPREQPVIAGEAAAFIFTAALGVSNGLAGSLPMMLAPDKVSATLREVTGNMMTLSYNIGLTAGSLVGYVFESMLGPQLPNPCPQYPFVPPKPNQPPGGFIGINATHPFATGGTVMGGGSQQNFLTTSTTTAASSTNGLVTATSTAATTIATLLTTLTATALRSTVANAPEATTISSLAAATTSSSSNSIPSTTLTGASMSTLRDVLGLSSTSAPAGYDGSQLAAMAATALYNATSLLLEPAAGAVNPQ